MTLRGNGGVPAAGVAALPAGIAFPQTIPTTAAGQDEFSSGDELPGAPYPAELGFALTAVAEWSAHVVAGYFELDFTLEISINGADWVEIVRRRVSTVVQNNPTWMQCAVTWVVPTFGSTTPMQVRSRLYNLAVSASAVTNASSRVAAVSCRIP